MERLPENKFLKFNPDTLDSLRKLYNLDKPGQMDEAIDLLDAWVKTQNHFVTKDFPREYLERIIIQLKGSVERAKSQMDKVCTLRTLLPKYFEKCDVRKDFKLMSEHVTMSLLPNLTDENFRIMFVKYEPLRYSAKILFHTYAMYTLIGEYIKAQDYCNGLAIVSDLRGMNIVEFVAQYNFVELKEILAIFLEAYDTRLSKIIFLTESKTIDVLMKILKQMLSEKLGKRIHVLKDVDELHAHLARELLPSDYGGEEKPLAVLADEFMKEMGSEENIKYFKEMSKVKTIESMRIPSEYNGDFSGLDGTFRTLNVD